MERAAQVHVEHRVEVLVGHLPQRCPPDVAGVVDQHVDATEALQRRVDDRLPALGGRHRVGAGDGFAAGRGDLATTSRGRAGVGTVAGQPAAGIVDHDLGAPRGQQQRVLAPQSPAATGDDGDAVVESQLSSFTVPRTRAVQVTLVAPLAFSRSPKA